jgi:hypothetical protein
MLTRKNYMKCHFPEFGERFYRILMVRKRHCKRGPGQCFWSSAWTWRPVFGTYIGVWGPRVLPVRTWELLNTGGETVIAPLIFVWCEFPPYTLIYNVNKNGIGMLMQKRSEKTNVKNVFCTFLNNLMVWRHCWIHFMYIWWREKGFKDSLWAK